MRYAEAEALESSEGIAVVGRAVNCDLRGNGGRNGHGKLCDTGGSWYPKGFSPNLVTLTADSSLAVISRDSVGVNSMLNGPTALCE